MRVDIRLATTGDRDAIRRIWGEQFGGADERADSWLVAALGGDDGTVAFVAVGEGQERVGATAAGEDRSDGETVVGFVVAARCPPAFVRSYVRGSLAPGDIPAETAVVHMLCVDDGWTGEGIGTRLVRECLRWASGRVGLVVAVSWLREGSVDSAPLFENEGFHRRSTIAGYYRDSRADCPDCAGQCTCAAAVFTREVEPGGGRYGTRTIGAISRSGTRSGRRARGTGRGRCCRRPPRPPRRRRRS